MDSLENSFIAATRSSRLKPVLAAVALVALAAGAWWMFGRGTGQPEDPARVLIVAPIAGLDTDIERKGFDPIYLSFGAAVGEGRAFDPSLDDVPAIVEYADQLGIGYVALSMANGEHYPVAELGYDAGTPPPGTTFMVLSIGDLGKHVSYGGVPPGVLHEHPLDKQIGLLLALLNQPELSKARTGQARNEIMVRFGSAGTIAQVEALERGQEDMRRQAAAWHALAEDERGRQKPIELAQPFERLLGWPLADGSILLGSARGTWHSDDGITSDWITHGFIHELSVITPDNLHDRKPCLALPEILDLDAGFEIAPSGDALLLPSTTHVAELWTLAGEGCGFASRGEIRRIEFRELGQPRAVGRTAAAQSGRLSWADSKMRAYRKAEFAGIELRPYVLQWVSDDVVVIPASLDFALAAADQHQRAIQAALEAGLPEPKLELSPAPPPDPIEALIFVRLPADDRAEAIELAVIPADALVRSDAVKLVAVFPGGESTVVTHVESRDGLQLIRTSLATSGPAWQDGLALEYDLATAAEAGRTAASSEVLAHDIPLEADHLAVSPTGSHAAWAAPASEDGMLEIFLLSLTSASETPVRMTNNSRTDTAPFFAGRLLVFASEYPVSGAPGFEALRAVPIP